MVRSQSHLLPFGFALAAALLLVVCAAVWMAVQNRRLRTQVEQLRAQQILRPTPQQTLPPELAAQLASEQERVSELTAQLNREQEQRAEAERRLKEATRRQAEPRRNQPQARPSPPSSR